MKTKNSSVQSFLKFVYSDKNLKKQKNFKALKKWFAILCRFEPNDYFGGTSFGGKTSVNNSMTDIWWNWLKVEI